MAYVQPRGTSHDLSAATLRQGTRLVAIAAYAGAVAVAFVLLSPVLPSRGSEASAVVPTGPEPELYTVARGETYAGVASAHLRDHRFPADPHSLRPNPERLRRSTQMYRYAAAAREFAQ